MDPSLYVVLDRAAAGRRDLRDILDAAVAGGARMFQLREKTWPSGPLLPLAVELRARCRRAGVTFIVNDRVDVALAADADGVHLGQDDLPPAAARPLLRPGMILGLSTHSVAQARAAQAAGADYVAVGSMFPTATKPDFELVGPELVRRVRGDVRVPLVGIGGITSANAGEVIAAGADGVAVIAAVCGADDPAAAARAILDAITRARRA
ncbi:MAG: thiamine phosphate synthase [Candidatus Rokubacteria bacterium]|nr:thiamine phosphate synthase [Candidatus Rokubacteria bacterium]